MFSSRGPVKCVLREERAFSIIFSRFVPKRYELKLKSWFFPFQVVSASSKQEAERKFETLLIHLSHPPSFTTVRVNTHLASVEYVRGLLLEELQKVCARVMGCAVTVLYLPQSAPSTAREQYDTPVFLNFRICGVCYPDNF